MLYHMISELVSTYKARKCRVAGPAQAFHLSARALRGVCPKLRMHLVAVPLAACWQCIPDSLQVGLWVLRSHNIVVYSF